VRGSLLLAISFLIGGADAAAGPSPPLHLRMIPRPDARCVVTALQLGLRSGIQQQLPLDPAVVVATAPVTVEVPARDSVMTVRPVSDGCWSELTTIAEGAEAVEVRFWPVAFASGELLGAAKRKPGRAVRGSFVDAAASDDTGAWHETTCELLGDERKWRCPLPAGRRLHLRVTLESFAPLYFWHLQAADGQVVDAGPARLIAGASVSGRVETERRRPLAKATVTLTPITAADNPAPERNARMLHAQTNADGVFQFTGVPLGTYRLSSAFSGRSDALLDRIDVDREEEILVGKPVVQSPLATLQLTVTPPVSARQQRWTVALLRPGPRIGEVARVAEGSVGADGVWTRDKLHAATYLLRVFDGDGSEVAQQSIVLHGGEERLLVAVSTIEVRGRILAGDDGVAGELVFDHLSGRRVRTRSDGDGLFSVSFPIAGHWSASAILSGTRLTLGDVTITSPHDRELELRVAGGRVKGKVVTERGEGRRAAVRARKDGRVAASTMADEKGAYELFGLEPASYSFEAEAEEEFAGPVAVDVGEERREDVDLRLSSWKKLEGVVVDIDGTPLSGAVIRLFDAATGTYQETIADGAGTYSLNVRPKTESVDAVVFAPPRPVAIRHLQLAESRNGSITIVVANHGATLRLLLSRTPPWPTLTTAGGVRLSLRLLMMPTFGGGAPREIVDGGFQVTVEEGAYAVCDATGSCRNVQLARFGQTIVDLTGSAKTAGN
jgi:hypothetical protein